MMIVTIAVELMMISISDLQWVVCKNNDGNKDSHDSDVNDNISRYTTNVIDTCSFLGTAIVNWNCSFMTEKYSKT